MIKKRKWLWAALAFAGAILAAAGLFVYLYIDKARHKSVRALVPTDVDGDDQDELLIYHNPLEGSSKGSSLLEATDTRHGKRLWSVMTSPAQYAAHPTRQDLVVSQGVAVVFSARYVGTGRCGDHLATAVAAHSTRDGKLLWKHTFRGETDTQPYWSIMADKKHVHASVSICENDGRRRSRFVSLQINSGKIAWSIELPIEGSARPISLKGKLLVWLYRNWIIDTSDGSLHPLSSVGPFRILGDDIYAFDWDQSGKVHRLNKVLLEKNELLPITIDGKHLSWSGGAKAYDGILSRDALFFTTKSAAVFEYTNYRTSDAVHAVATTDPFKLERATSLTWPNFASEFAPHLAADDRFTLCFLTDSSGKYPQEADWRLAILDAEERSIAWRSERIPARQRPSSAYHYRLGDKEIVVLNLFDKARKPVGCMLVFDRARGDFINAVKIYDDKRPIDAHGIGRKLLPWHRSGMWLYGITDGNWWRVKIDEPIGEARAELQFYGCFKDAQGILGKIPR